MYEDYGRPNVTGIVTVNRVNWLGYVVKIYLPKVGEKIIAENKIKRKTT